MTLSEDDVTRAIGLGLKIAAHQLRDIAAAVPGEPHLAAAGMVCCGVVGLVQIALNAGADRDRALAEVGESLQRLFIATAESTMRIMSPAGKLHS